MTQVVMLEMKNIERPTEKDTLSQLSQMIEGACNEDGSWKKGWQPNLIQTYVRHEDVGKYVVVHNLNNNRYSLSVSLIKANGNIAISDMNDISFRIDISISGEAKDCGFRFAISVIGDK